ncbi:Nucleolar protein 12 [Cyphellophora attinorum]|uniref:Nucleolar protein 12 n=1 Tax=Cyphellophora attinorum TaxID=1664694 RepID=A0A0N0NRM2_9EURO|nr:Nucleolar protein 12 [Phialophora attinorum]KPI45248.1 Nucleolar protein 12 [Phialophora attinorum]
MGKKEKRARDGGEKPVSEVEVPAAKFDPALASLFATSSGPVKVTSQPARKVETVQKKPAPASDLPTPEDTDLEASDADSDGSDRSSEGQQPEVENERPRKRRKVNDEDLEDVYFRKLAQEEQRDLQRQRDEADAESEISDSPSNDLMDLSDDEADAIPVHESLTTANEDKAADAINRTVFLSNVSTLAIKSKASKKTLLSHLETALPASTKIESIRFRSTAYSKDAGPKKAAYATKALMDETASSTHAYVVLSTVEAAQALVKLNGTIILDRHLHVDHLGSATTIVHKRCVFVGNLPFVDQETLDTPAEDNPRQRPRAKQRSDPEEGLWRTFARAGTVENVRMVRDKMTRVGKGFAYVQFTDENAVEKALLMNEKKFPPLLPRKLRVMRSKRPAAKPKALDAKRKGVQLNGKSSDRRGKAVQDERNRDAGKRKQSGGGAGGRDKRSNPLGKSVVFEGYRASASKPMKGKDTSKQQKKRPTNRSASRGAAFKAGRGKKKRDMKK